MKREFHRNIFLNALLPIIVLFFCNNLTAQKRLTAFTDKNKKMGYKDASGAIVIPAKYDDAEFFFEERAVVSLNKKWGVIDDSGKEIVGPKYDSLSSIYWYSYVKVKQNGKWGFLDRLGKEVIPIQYQAVHSFYENIAPVKQNNKWGFINRLGKEIVPFKFQDAKSFDGGLSLVLFNNKWGAIDKTGKETISFKYDSLEYGRMFGEPIGLLKGKLDGKWGFIISNGSIALPFKYEGIKEYRMKFDDTEDDSTYVEEIGDFFFDIEMVKLNGKWGAIDFDGKEAIPIKYQDIRNESHSALVMNGWYRVKLNNKWGLVDTLGRELIAPQYSSVYFKYDTNVVNKIAASYAKSVPKNNQGAGGAPQSGQQQTKAITPPLSMKGIIDPAIVGTWKYHDDAINFNGFYIFRADGTYDYYADMITPDPPPPSYKNFWRVDGEYMEFIVDGKNEVIRQKVLRRNDPQNKKPALVIPWNSATKEYRTYYPTQAHDLWPSGLTSQKTNGSADIPASAVKLVEPPMHLNGNVDPAIVGLWKGTMNNIDYYLDIKPDGTYVSYQSNNRKQIVSYWRINGDHIEVFFEGAKQINKYGFKKVNDLNLGKPAISFDGFRYYPVAEREMWQ